MRYFKAFIVRLLLFFGYKIQKIKAGNNENYAGMSSNSARFFFRTYCYNQTKLLKGDLVECGVGSGYGLLFLKNLQRQSEDFRTIWAFDTFEGFPKGTKGKDADWFIDNGRPDYTEYNQDSVIKKIKTTNLSDKELSNVKMVKGFFPKTFENCSIKNVALVNIDVDLYQSTKDAIQFFWPLLCKGGIAMLDEYDRGTDVKKWPGPKIAIDEFCKQENIILNRHFTGMVFLIKA